MRLPVRARVPFAAVILAALASCAAPLRAQSSDGPAPLRAQSSDGPAPLRAQSSDGVVRAQVPTTDDAAALALRVKALEAKLEAMWSLRQGPELLALDTVDRMATRLMALEARLAAVEEATGIREARASHAHGGDPTFEVSLALLAMFQADWSPEAAADPARLQESLRLRQLARTVAWPEGLKVKAAQLDEVWRAWAQDAGRLPGAQDAGSRLAAQAHDLAIIRRDLGLAAGNWVESMIAAAGKPHDHSGTSSGAHADHSPHHGGQVAMKGDVHLELCSEGPGRWRVFLTDAFRRPLDASAWSGSLVLFPDDDAPREVLLTAGAEALDATTAPAGRSPVDVRVQLVAPEALVGQLGPAAAASGSRDVATDFSFASEGAGGAGEAEPVHPPDCPMNPANREGGGASSAAPERPVAGTSSRPRRWR